MTTYDMPWYSDSAVGIQQIYVEELERKPNDVDFAGAATWLFHMREEGHDLDWVRAQVRESDEWHAVHDKPPLPPVPTRDEILNGRCTQQGLVIHTTEFGDMPWWGACWAWLSSESRKEAAQQLIAHGDTICLIGLPSGTPLYDEPNQFYSADKFPALDMTAGGTTIEPAFIALIDEALQLGFKGCWVFLDGDDGANGYEIAVRQTGLLGPALGALNDYVVQIPGWDGVWHAPAPVVGTGYTPAMIQSFATEARAAGAKYVGVEHGTGYLLLGGGERDFSPGGQMTGYDLILGEFEDGRFDGTVWQVLGRMIRPYHRPPDQDLHDHPADPLYLQAHDPNPPYYLNAESPRGPYVYRVFEFAIYGWVRGRTSAQIAEWRAYFEGCGATNVC